MALHFKVDIELGNTAMKSAAHVANKLLELSRRVRGSSFKEGEGGKIFDDNGREVGKWEIVNDAVPSDG